MCVCFLFFYFLCLLIFYAFSTNPFISFREVFFPPYFHNWKIFVVCILLGAHRSSCLWFPFFLPVMYFGVYFMFVWKSTSFDWCHHCGVIFFSTVSVYLNFVLSARIQFVYRLIIIFYICIFTFTIFLHTITHVYQFLFCYFSLGVNIFQQPKMRFSI